MQGFTPPSVNTMSRELSSRLAKEARKASAGEPELTREQRLLRSMVKDSRPPSPSKPRPVNLADELPEEFLMDCSFKLFILQNLAWDYVETILDVCAQQKIKDTKPLVRTVRDLRRRYEIFRCRCVDSKHTAKETAAALRFESEVADDLKRFHNAVGIDSSRIDLSSDARVLISAVQDAMLILDAIKIYARSLDREIAAMGIWTCDCCLVQEEVLKLYSLIPLFGGDCYEVTSKSRSLSAAIIVNRLRDIELTFHNADEDE